MSTEKEQKEALKKIEALKEKAYKLLAEATQIADEADVPFSWDLAYGMGGTYYPKKKKAEATPEGEEEEYTDSDEGGWESSNCY